MKLALLGTVSSSATSAARDGRNPCFVWPLMLHSSFELSSVVSLKNFPPPHSPSHLSQSFTYSPASRSDLWSSPPPSLIQPALQSACRLDYHCQTSLPPKMLHLSMHQQPNKKSAQSPSPMYRRLPVCAFRV